MTILDDHRRPRRRVHHIAALVLVGALGVTACSSGTGGGQGAETTTQGSDRPDIGTLPTIPGGVELTHVDPARVLVGVGLAFGSPLPSQQAAADAYAEDPEVTSALVRRVYSRLDGRLVADATVLQLVGSEIFDAAVLTEFERGVVASLGDGKDTVLEIAGRPVSRSRGGDGTVLGFVEGDQLVVVRGADEHDVGVVVERQLTAVAAGAAGSLDPETPLRPSAIDAVFVPVSSLTFEPFPPPEDEPAPEPPALPGVSAVEGRYGVVAGERRTTVWVYALDAEAYPTEEALLPALAGLVSARADGAPAKGIEVIDRLVPRATASTGSPSVAAFRERGLAVVVEGTDAAQVDAVVSAWIAALTAP